MAATNPTPARSARLTPDGRAVEITQMSLTDPTVVHAAQTWAQRHRDQAAAPGVGQLDLTPFVEESMRLAAVVWQAGGDSRDVIGIQQTLGHVTERTEKAVAEASERSTQANKHAQEQLDRVRDETAKALSLATTTSTRQMAATADKVGEDIAKLFGGDDNPLVASARAAIGRAMTDVQTSFEQRMQQVVADVDSKWDPRVPTSPVAQMTAWFKVEQDKLLAVHHDTGREVTAKLDQIATQLVALSTTKTVTARTASVTPLKGAPFEDQVHTAIEGIAAGLGDGYLRAGTTVGAVKNSKRGDGVLVVHDVPGASEGTANVVIEASNRDTPRDWSTYLDERHAQPPGPGGTRDRPHRRAGARRGTHPHVGGQEGRRGLRPRDRRPGAAARHRTSASHAGLCQRQP